MPALGKSICGASTRGLRETSESQAVRTLHKQAGNPDTGRASTCPPTGFSAWWPLEIPAWDRDCTIVPLRERDTHTHRPLPVRPVRRASAIKSVALRGPQVPPQPGTGYRAWQGRRPGGRRDGARAPSGGRRVQNPKPGVPGAPQPGGGDSSRGPLLTDLAAALSFLQKGSTVAVKPNFCKINKNDRDDGSVKRERSALPP